MAGKEKAGGSWIKAGLERGPHLGQDWLFCLPESCCDVPVGEELGARPVMMSRMSGMSEKRVSF